MHRRMTHLNNEELEWMQNFNRYTICGFSSNRGSESILAVKEISIWNSRSPFFISSNQSWDYEAAAAVEFEILQRDRLLDGYFQFRKVLPEKSLVVQGKLGDLRINDRVERDVRGFEYDGKLFSECVILDSLNSHILRNSFYPFENDVQKAVISKEYGLIYYSFSDGEEFFREF